MRGAAAFRSPFGHDLRRASVTAGELEIEDRRSMRDVRGVDHFEDHRERDGGDPEQDQGVLAMGCAYERAGSVARPSRSWLIVNSERRSRPSVARFSRPPASRSITHSTAAISASRSRSSRQDSIT